MEFLIDPIPTIYETLDASELLFECAKFPIFFSLDIWKYWNPVFKLICERIDQIVNDYQIFELSVAYNPQIFHEKVVHWKTVVSIESVVY